MKELMILLVERWGYLGVLFLIAVENIFPPIPSEVILTFSGFLTTYTSLGKWGVIWAATAGSLLGALVLYGAGRAFSVDKLERILNGKVGRILHFNGDEVRNAFDWFNEKGKSTVLICRCIPILRSLISIPAGMAGMSMTVFLPFTLAGSFLWNVILVNLGVIAGGAWEQVVEKTGILGQVVTWGLLLLVFIGTGFLMKRMKKKIM
ncbi:MAG: DedA family protein [Lachnospiraceae bacterium]|jgi:membrane protein DedA with SNARE-associated domain|nr:DedA family protein [Lachnospiraceae bacterium]